MLFTCDDCVNQESNFSPIKSDILQTTREGGWSENYLFKCLDINCHHHRNNMDFTMKWIYDVPDGYIRIHCKRKSCLYPLFIKERKNYDKVVITDFCKPCQLEVNELIKEVWSRYENVEKPPSKRHVNERMFKMFINK